MPKSLVIIDFINEFLHPDGKITPQGYDIFCRENDTVQNVKKLISYFRETKQEIIWVHLGFHPNYDNCSTISPRFKWAPTLWILQENTWSTQFIEELVYDPNEKTITKTRVSPFYKTELEEYLHTQGISEIVVVGLSTDLAVSTISHEAHDRDISCTVISDACGTISKEHHEAALIGIGKLSKVVSTEEFIKSN